MLIRGLYSETKPLSAITSCCWVKWEVSQSRDPLDTELWPSCNLCLRIWLFRVSADKLTPSASKLAVWQTLTPDTSLTPLPGYLQWAVSSLPACRKEFISDFPHLSKRKQSHWAFWVMLLDLKRSPKIILYPHNDISLSLSLTLSEELDLVYAHVLQFAVSIHSSLSIQIFISWTDVSMLI